MAVRKDLAGKWLHKIRASQIAGWMGEQLPTPPPRRLLAEGDVEIDERAYRAIMRVCRRAKPGDAPLAFTNLQLDGKEFIKLFRKTPAKGARRPISEHDMREMLQLAKADKEPGKVFGVRDAQTLLDKTRRPYDRDLMRTIMRNLSGRGPGRPRKVIK